MKSHAIKKLLIPVFLCVTVLNIACSTTVVSAEDEIRLLIKQGVEAAENRSSGDVADLLQDNFQGKNGLGKQQIKKMLSVYFFRHKNIYLFTKIRDIKLHSKKEASVTLHVAMAGSVIANVSVLASLRAKVYKFELELVKQDEWLLQQVKWSSARLNDIN